MQRATNAGGNHSDTSTSRVRAATHGRVHFISYCFMSNGMVSLAPNVVRVHLQVLCNFHMPVLRAGEERLRVAMAEYAQTMSPAPERDVAFRKPFSPAGA